MTHGTNGGYINHMKRGEQACQPCRDGHAAYQREWRARQPGNTNRVYATSWERRVGKEYVNEQHRLAASRRRFTRRRGRVRDVILDYLETFGPYAQAGLIALIQDRHPDIPAATIKRTWARLWHEGLVDRRWSHRDGAFLYRVA